MSKKIEHNESIAQDYEHYDEVSKMTVDDINSVMEQLFMKIVDGIGAGMTLDMHDSAHEFANNIMDTANGGVVAWLEDKGVDKEYAIPVFLLTLGIIGIDLVQTFTINLHMKGWLKHEEVIECQGKCPVCGSENCNSIDGAVDPDGPVSCECEDCGSTWVCK